MTGRDDSRRPNIVLLNLDSARKDIFGCYGGSLGLTPNLDRLAKNGLLLENHYAPGPGSAQSHVSIFTGQHSARHGMVHNLCEVKPDLKAMPALLRGSVFQRVVRTLQYKYIWQSNGDHYLFRVGEAETPENNRYQSAVDVVKDLHEKMLCFYESIDANFKIDEYPIVLGRTAGAYLTNPLIREELKRLGYL